MTVWQLMDMLDDVIDKNLPINLIVNEKPTTNYWLHTIEESSTGSSGYEVSGEVRLIGIE